MALLTLCIAWGWHNVGGCLALAWGAFLRAGEVINGLRRDLLLPCDVEDTIGFGLFSILEPKTRNVAARHQSAKLDIPDLLEYVQLTLGPLLPHQRLWPHSGQTLRAGLKSLLQCIGLPVDGGSGLKPLDLGSLRAGGATWALTMTENPELVRRRGRWINAKTMEVYVQELAATQYLSLVPPPVKLKVFIFHLGESFSCDAELFTNFPQTGTSHSDLASPTAQRGCASKQTGMMGRKFQCWSKTDPGICDPTQEHDGKQGDDELLTCLASSGASVSSQAPQPCPPI